MIKKTKKKPKIRNGFEAALELQLKLSGVKFNYESEKIAYIIAGHYIPDFPTETPTGKIYIEAKGHFRREDKRKLRAVKTMHPEMDIRIVFYRRSKINERWAIRNGFKYAFGRIPQEWLDGY